MVVTAAALSAVRQTRAPRPARRRDGRLARRRSRPDPESRSNSGNASGATTISRSSCRRSGEREVARTVRPGQAAKQVGHPERRLGQVFEVVEHQQQPAGAEGRPHDLVR